MSSRLNVFKEIGLSVQLRNYLYDLEKLLSLETNIDHVYFVDAAATGRGNGRSWDDAYTTVTTAMAAVDDDYTNDADYWVFIAPGEYVEDDILVAGHGIHVIGVGIPGNDSGVHILGESGAAYGVFAFAAANSALLNVALQAAGAQPCFYAPAFDNSILANCTMTGVTATTTSMTEMDDTRNCKLIGNTFGNAGNSAATSIMYFEGGANQYLIDSLIRDNRIYSNAASVVGILIDNTCTTYGNVIDHNFINLGSATGTVIGIDNNSTGVNLYTDNYIVVPSGATDIESASSPTGIIGNHTMAGSTVVDPQTVAT